MPASFWAPQPVISRGRVVMGGVILIRELPRGPFGAFLRAHYLSQPSAVSRFAMGCGAIFMIQRVRPMAESLLGEAGIAETDPALLEEMVALVMAQGLDVVSLSEAKRRLEARDFKKRFVSFTFDGGFKSTVETALPLFKKRGLPFTIFVGTRFVDTGQLPWWITLEALVMRSSRLVLHTGGKAESLSCAGAEEKRRSYGRLYRHAARLGEKEREEFVEALRGTQGLGAAAHQEMLSGPELKALSGEPLAEIGSQGGGGRPLSELSYDDAKDDLMLSLDGLEAILGSRPRHIAFPGTQAASAGVREYKLAATLGIETAVTAVEGALWPEHAAELFALPRIALDNDPATLVRALMLSGGTPFSANSAATA